MRALADAALSVPPPAEPIDDDGEAICPSCGKPCWSFREMRHCEHCMTPLAPPAEPVPEDERDDRARRYIAVVQAPEGYPPPDRPHATEASIQPTIHTVVLETDYLAALRASRPSPALTPEQQGSLNALVEALDSHKPLVWSGNVLCVFDADVPDSDLWKAQARMVLDADDYAALRALPDASRQEER